MLLAYLTVTRQPQSRQHLISLLWPDSTEEAALKNLRNLLWQLRGKIGSNTLISTSDTVAINRDAVSVDLNRVQLLSAELLKKQNADTLHSLLTTLRGGLLDDFVVNNVPEFESWLLLERAHTNREMIALLSRHCQQYRQNECWNELRLVASKGLQLDSLHEPFVLAQMTADSQLGKRTEALRQYQQFEAHLKREMDVVPSVELTDLFQRLTKGNLPTSQPAKPQPTDSLPEHLPFVGRQIQLHSLQRLLTRASSGSPTVGMIVGQRGSGKTRLVTHFLAQLKKQQNYVTVALGKRASNEMPLNQLLSIVLRQLQAAYPEEKLSYEQRIAMATLASDLRTKPYAGSTEAEPIHLYEKMGKVISDCAFALANSPLVLFIDNGMWANKILRPALIYILSQLRDVNAPILLLLAIDRELLERGNSDAASILRLERSFSMVRIQVEPLNEAAVTKLVESASKHWQVEPLTVSVRARFIAFAMAQSRGNAQHLALLFEQCCKLSRDANSAEIILDKVQKLIPRLIADSVRVKLKRLPVTCQKLLYALAVWHKPISFDDWARLTQIGPTTMVNAIEALQQAHLIEECSSSSLPEGYRFIFPFEQAAVVQQAGIGRKSILRQRIKEVRG